ncbi:MAG TPA: hypothetical protein VKW04_07665 [Planctomycetota bacterium]|nr:hypothetical protein [Planctomycetota bacterium]
MAARPEETPNPRITVTEHEGYLEATLQATDSMKVVQDQLEEIFNLCVERKPPRLLVDMTPATGSPSTLQRYEFGVIGGRLAPFVGRVAVLAQAIWIDPQKIGVTVARNRGLSVEIFDNRQAGVSWLLG